MPQTSMTGAGAASPATAAFAIRPITDRLVARGIPRESIHDRVLDRHTRANDASHFLLIPQAVAVADSADAVTRLMAACSRERIPLTFRSGGTSLSGQAQSDSLLVDTRRAFRGIEVLDDGAVTAGLVRVEPGATVRQVNAALARHGRKIGPDPASEGACTIGGVVANNSSGMACGTRFNSYNTLAALRFILPSGTIVDTGLPDADARLAHDEPDLHTGLLELRDRVCSSPSMRATITKQYAMKNTMGYGVNAFVDFETPADILAHLVVGSEGTLAFIASATFRTLPVLPQVSTGLLVFPDVVAATAALPALVATDAATLELLDAQSLRVCQADPTASARLRALPVREHAAILVEYQASGAQELDAMVERSRREFDWSQGGEQLTSDPAARNALWHLRKGLYATVAGARASGTTAMLEDIAVPVPALSETCAALTGLFDTHGYDGNVIFGHAKDGNIHFMVVEDFAEPSGVARHEAFTHDMVDLVLSRGGTLKAEHGTGRFMAGYVRRQFGDELYDVMRAIKPLVDPAGMLNPGIVITDDAQLHLRDLKTVPRVEEEVDRCVECGFCEPVCPSKDLTLTPRQRIVGRRALARARADGAQLAADEMSEDYRYDGVQTCAADGMCATVCPVGIDTGTLVRRLRAEDVGAVAQAAGRTAARNWGAASRGAGLGLSLARRLPGLASAATRLARQAGSEDLVPQWSTDLPAGGQPRAVAVAQAGTVVPSEADLVIFASCTTSMFGGAQDSCESSTAALLSLCAKAGLRVTVPDGMASLCCGMPWSSKGLTSGKEVMASRVAWSLSRATDGGRLPVVVDAASCTEGLVKLVGADPAYTVVDAVAFVARHVLPRLTVTPSATKVAVHPTCASTELGTTPALLELAAAVAGETFVPLAWGCCAFAGDRGLLHPELTASATAAQAAQVRASGADLHVSCNRTCELGMSRAVGEPYRNILEVLDSCSTARSAIDDIDDTDDIHDTKDQ